MLSKPESDPGLKPFGFIDQRWQPLTCPCALEVCAHLQFCALLIPPRTRRSFFFLGLEAGFCPVSSWSRHPHVPALPNLSLAQGGSRDQSLPSCADVSTSGGPPSFLSFPTSLLYREAYQHHTDSASLLAHFINSRCSTRLEALKSNFFEWYYKLLVMLWPLLMT